ncbi:cysteine hydrolase [Prosthecochloris sp. SCSIO W1101]|uniref:cysteine hydrolase family protein n=1 Tax=Prosthecochloris sp. SCSIO W1101 TaxID=2992242 RepID=UPI00223C92B5|nr:isochorismatase family cysteine hydrolase [Prosthecochloris sp. SCSIO W1101]UZJ41232.1 cysteine hydrolase [Prosthecochloris sp. SCSIO W1101]
MFSAIDHTEPDFSRAALLTIDVQRDFVLPGAPAEIVGSEDVVPGITKLLGAFREAGKPIIHIVRLYQPDGSNADLSRRELVRSGKSIVLPGSQGAELLTELLPGPDVKLDCSLLLAGGIQEIGSDEVVIYKPRWGAFFQTPLEQHLAGLEVNTVVISGCNFPNCPRTTIYEASERDFKVVLADDAVSGFYRQAGQELLNIGVHLYSSRKLVSMLNE